MKMPDIPFLVMDWNQLPAEQHPGESGISFWRTLKAGDMRLRLVGYTPGFRSDHWCAKGHVLLVLEGEVTVKLKDGREHRLGPGMGFVAGDNESNPHLAVSEKGAKVFLVD